ALAPADSSIAPEKVSAYRLKHPIQAIYRSRIAYQLAGSQSGEELAAKLASMPLDGINLEFLTFRVEIGESSLLDFHLSDCSFARWLQQLPQRLCQLRQPPISEFRENQDDLFFLEYVHARCCSLLRLGHREGLIQFVEPKDSQSGWQWQAPTTVPWLDSEGKFQLVDESERHLSLQFLAVADAIDHCSVPNWRVLATDLGEAVLVFERQCRIFGEIKRKNAQLSQVRLGLTALSQLLLQVLLEDKLGLSAIREL
ncbi:MAG: hypothetical protein ACKO2V_18500, partial [Snowella sp.]